MTNNSTSQSNNNTYIPSAASVNNMHSPNDNTYRTKVAKYVHTAPPNEHPTDFKKDENRTTNYTPYTALFTSPPPPSSSFPTSSVPVGSASFSHPNGYTGRDHDHVSASSSFPPSSVLSLNHRGDYSSFPTSNHYLSSDNFSLSGMPPRDEFPSSFSPSAVRSLSLTDNEALPPSPYSQSNGTQHQTDEDEIADDFLSYLPSNLSYIDDEFTTSQPHSDDDFSSPLSFFIPSDISCDDFSAPSSSGTGADLSSYFPTSPSGSSFSSFTNRATSPLLTSFENPSFSSFAPNNNSLPFTPHTFHSLENKTVAPRSLERTPATSFTSRKEFSSPIPSRFDAQNTPFGSDQLGFAKDISPHFDTKNSLASVCDSTMGSFESTVSSYNNNSLSTNISTDNNDYNSEKSLSVNKNKTNNNEHKKNNQASNNNNNSNNHSNSNVKKSNNKSLKRRRRRNRRKRGNKAKQNEEQEEQSNNNNSKENKKESEDKYESSNQLNSGNNNNVENFFEEEQEYREEELEVMSNISFTQDINFVPIDQLPLAERIKFQNLKDEFLAPNNVIHSVFYRSGYKYTTSKDLLERLGFTKKERKETVQPQVRIRKENSNLFTKKKMTWMTTGDQLGKQYLQLRKEAIWHAQTRNKFFEAATQAYLANNKVTATKYSKLGRHHHKKMQELHQKAGEEIFLSRNLDPNKPEDVLDLHGLHRVEALYALERYLLFERDRKKFQSIYVITGTGHHSSTKPKLLPAVEEYLQQNNYVFWDASTDKLCGMLGVSLKVQ
eukprot:CAMPEP_0174268954 /NCGR_PEP_ID=MMETSP0439-20130205/39267_1 /TAXON_ID=0 /ORGANISM="Stereomyxa ramosa, Strain Chinc5" /LENGTH=773 /DNA_ID=CAMNT_0015357441 /DNA_START=434 /DNA_END=2755 /DNA_ORIENTATION=+